MMPKWLRNILELVSAIVLNSLKTILSFFSGGRRFYQAMESIERADMSARLPKAMMLRKRYLYTLWGWITVLVFSAYVSYISFFGHIMELTVGIFFCILALCAILVIIRSAVLLHKLKKV